MRYIPPRRACIAALTCLSATALAGCTHRVKVDPIKVEPIDITLHIYLKADEKLDSFFDYQDEQPVTAPDSPAASTPGRPAETTGDPAGGAQ